MERAEDSSHFLCSPPESEAESHNLGLLISLYNFETSSCLVLEFTGSLPWGGHPGCRKAEGKTAFSLEGCFLLFKFPHTQSHISPSSIHTPTTTSSLLTASRSSSSSSHSHALSATAVPQLSIPLSLRTVQHKQEVVKEMERVCELEDNTG